MTVCRHNSRAVRSDANTRDEACVSRQLLAQLIQGVRLTLPHSHHRVVAAGDDGAVATSGHKLCAVHERSVSQHLQGRIIHNSFKYTGAGCRYTKPTQYKIQNVQYETPTLLTFFKN